MAYNSAYTGQEIDAAIGSVKSKESTWDDKQDKITGQQGQIVGFDSQGNAVAQDDSGRLPTGGTPGQMLYQGENGAEWGDRPVMVVNITGSSESGYQADKTFAEINDALNAGIAVFAVTRLSTITGILPLSRITFDQAMFEAVLENSIYSAIVLKSDETVSLVTYFLSANFVGFDNSDTNLNAIEVQSAIEEVYDMASPWYVNLTVNVESMTYQADRTFAEIKHATENGYNVQVRTNSGDTTFSFPLIGITELGACFGGVHPYLSYDSAQGTYSQDGQQLSTAIISPDGSVLVGSFYVRVPGDSAEYIPIARRYGIDRYIKLTDFLSRVMPRYVSITLPASGWSNNSQTVTVSGVLADETAQLIQPMPAMASQSAYYGAEVLCSGQAANSLTFTCQTVPTADLTVYVVMQEVGA